MRGGGPVTLVPGAEIKPEPVLFSIYGPPRIAAGSPFTLDVWAFLKKQRDKVDALATRLGQKAAETATANIARSSVLALQIYAADLDIQDPVRPVTWNGQETFESFECGLKPSAAGRFEADGKVVITLNGLLIASLDFWIRIGHAQTDAPQGQLNQTAHRPETAFASYASADRGEVLRSVQGISKGAPNLDIFVDVDKLRSGNDWEKKLYAYISTSDIFYLFWSKAAAASEWVTREWQYALREKGIHFIDPFPLESPQVVSPPKELGTLHFNDRYLMFILAQEQIDTLKKQTAQTAG